MSRLFCPGESFRRGRRGAFEGVLPFKSFIINNLHTAWGPSRNRGHFAWSGKRDSNPQPSAWKADALAIELFPLTRTHSAARAAAMAGPPPPHRMVGRGGFEPPKASPTDLQSVPFDRSGTSPEWLELARGLEPPTPSLQVRSSTIELRQHGVLSRWWCISSQEPARVIF